MRLYIAGIQGMVGSAVSRLGASLDFEIFGSGSKHLDFKNRDKTFSELSSIKPDYLVIAAAKVGGIGANSKFPVEFLSENLQIQTNLIDASHEAGIKKVLFLGSSCIYPKFAQQPISESSLMTGELEPTNEPYAIAKIAGLKLIEAYRKEFNHSWVSGMPTNLYGPGDNFDLENSHVLPALIHRFHKAKIDKSNSVTIWGDGTPLREFLHVDDLARAVFVLLDSYDGLEPINIGSGQEISILHLAEMISGVVGYKGAIQFDQRRPNGTPRKLLDSTNIFSLGWKPTIELKTGIESTYDWFLSSQERGQN